MSSRRSSSHAARLAVKKFSSYTHCLTGRPCDDVLGPGLSSNGELILEAEGWKAMNEKCFLS